MTAPPPQLQTNKVLIKIGGTLIDSADLRAELAGQIAGAQASGMEIVVVHGGGKQVTQFLTERGIESRFVNGLRATTPETLDAVVKVLAGSVNLELVAAFVKAGAMAVGLSGIDAGLVEADQMDPALGAVGRVRRANPALLWLLTANRYLPVIACLAGDRQGNLFNVNADQMAVACAAAFGARHLIFLTDVPGVLDASKNVRHILTAQEARQLIADGAVTGGMQAKLNAANDALEQGVKEIHIVPGAARGVIDRVLAGQSHGQAIGQAIGTRLQGPQMQRVSS